MSSPSLGCFDLLPRGKRSILAGAFILVVSYIVFIIHVTRIGDDSQNTTDIHYELKGTTDHVIFQLCILTTGIIVLCLAELLYRFTLIFEEGHHLTSRYDDSVFKMLKTVFSVKCTTRTVMAFIISVVVLLSIRHSFQGIYISFITSTYTSYFLPTQIILNSIILVYIGLRAPSAVEISDIGETEVLNVAHGLAWSFYVGYLRILGKEMANRISRSKQYEIAKNDTTMKMVNKLFILLPQSCYTPRNLNEKDTRISHEGQLEDHIENRAGNIKRPYRNAVYKIDKSAQETYFVVAEYATPLMSIYEMSSMSHSGLDAQGREKQMKLFYNTLKKILKDDNNCKDFVLVPFEDRDDEGNEVRIGDKLMDAINDVELEERKARSF